MDQRMYKNAADKQRAYRDRLRAQGLVTAPPRTAKPKRISRPARLSAIEGSLRQLATEYQTWLDTMPENLAESQLAEQLAEMVEQLEALADEVGALPVPRIGHPR